MSLDFTRQEHIFDPSKQKSNIIVMGAGSVGSFVTLNLAKLGFENISVYDFDKVESVNIPNQFYRLSDVDKFKVEALQEIVKEFTGTEIKIFNEKVDENTNLDIDLNTIVILAFDNMEARKIVYDLIKEFPINLVDTRMGGTGFNIFSVNLSDDKEKEEFEKHLNAEVTEAPCGEKAVIYTILSITSETCQIVKDIDTNDKIPTILKREMPVYRFLTNLK